MIYPDDYFEQCFQSWYAAGCPINPVKVIEVIPEFDGDKPTWNTIRRTMSERGWAERADAMNSKAIQIAEDNLIHKKADMLARQAQMAQEVQESAMEYLRTEGYDSSSSAVQALFKAADLELTRTGLSETIVKIARMSGDELMKEAAELLKRHSEAVEGEIIPTDEEVEIERMEDD